MIPRIKLLEREGQNLLAQAATVVVLSLEYTTVPVAIRFLTRLLSSNQEADKL